MSCPMLLSMSATRASYVLWSNLKCLQNLRLKSSGSSNSWTLISPWTPLATSILMIRISLPCAEDIILMKKDDLSLHSFVKSLRKAKTRAEERKIVLEETAGIRQTFQSGIEVGPNVYLKAILIDLMGHPTELNVFQCLVSLSSPSVKEKKLAYLAVSLLGHLYPDLLVLVTNTISKDLKGASTMGVCLALSTIASLSSYNKEISLNLVRDVTQLLDHQDEQVVKKSIGCLCGIVRACEFVEDGIVSRLKRVVERGSMDLLPIALQLVLQTIKVQEGLLEEYRKLYEIVGSKWGELQDWKLHIEYQHRRVPSPFLQERIIRFLSLYPDMMMDGLGDTISIVLSSYLDPKYSGVIMETVLFAARINRKALLERVEVVLKCFINSSIPNLVFSVLNTLNKIADFNPGIVSEYAIKISKLIDFKDNAIAIAALHLSSKLINSENINSVLSNYLVAINRKNKEISGLLVSKISSALMQFSIEHPLHFNIVLQVCQIYEEPPEDMVYNCLNTLQSNKAMQSIASSQLFSLVKKGEVNEFIVRMAIYSIGQFPSSVSPTEFLRTIEDLSSLSPVNLEFLCTSLFKLGIAQPSFKEEIFAFFQTHVFSVYPEIQQRACEYTTILSTFSHLLPIN